VQNLAAVLETVFTTHVAELRTVEQATLDADLGPAVRPGASHREAPNTTVEFQLPILERRRHFSS
jgi:hypothetical protein